MRSPSGLSAAVYTSPSRPSSGSPIGLPLVELQIRAVLSAEAVTMRLPSGRRSGECRAEWSLLCSSERNLSADRLQMKQQTLRRGAARLVRRNGRREKIR